jgi:restriction system protein
MYDCSCEGVVPQVENVAIGPGELSNEETPAAWLIRAGRDGEREDLALREGLVIVGWDELGDIGHYSSKEALREEVRRTYPDGGKARISNWTGQLWRFIDTISDGDHVVMPLKTRYPLVAIGRVAGTYEYRCEAPAGFRHVRPVEWLQTDISREAIKQDLRDSMGSLLTVCGLARFGAARRIGHLVEYGVDPGSSVSKSSTYHAKTRSDLLVEAAERDPGDPVRLTIRDLLGHWDSARRTHGVVATVEADLADKGLTTRPPFTEGWIDNIVELVPVGEEPISGRPSAAAQVADDTEDIPDLPPVALRIGDLQAANSGVTSVKPETSLEEAVTIMLMRGFSQLGVIDGNDNYHGAVSWESIGKAHIADPHAALMAATATAPVADHDELLLEQIEQIYSKDFVFVRSPDKSRISGIVTAADLTRQFGNLARPFVLIEEAERRLRRRADEVFSVTELRAAARGPKAASVEKAADLTLGNYPFLLGPKESWAKLGWSIDRKLFLALLDSVNKTRNELMHFSPDPLTDDQLSDVNGFLDLLRTVDPRP